MEATHESLINLFIQCDKCRLRLSRRNVSVYRGSFPSSLMLIGEAPGEDEDSQGRPLVGPVGAYLNHLLEQAGVPLNAPYITNLVKCRPPKNQAPKAIEVASCRCSLQRQVSLVHPKRIVTLGEMATSVVTGNRGPMSKQILSDSTCFWDEDFIVIPVYHPADLLENPDPHRVQDTILRLRRAWVESKE